MVALLAVSLFGCSKNPDDYIIILSARYSLKDNKTYQQLEPRIELTNTRKKSIKFMVFRVKAYDDEGNMLDKGEFFRTF